jgi:hypothetical protein
MAQTTQHREHGAEPTEAERQAHDQAATRAARDEAEAKTQNMPLPGSDVVGRLDGAAFAKLTGDHTTKMMVPEAFALTTDDYQTVYFNSGIQEVPSKLADHPYLKGQGVTAV